MRFNGEAIWGTQTWQEGPEFDYRVLEQRIPGVDGLRVYRLGAAHGGVWVVGGRVTTTTPAQLEQFLYTAGTYQDGNLYVFESNGGQEYANCQLLSYKARGRWQRIRLGPSTLGCTVQVQGVVRRAAV